ncbi:AraC family transcriptional regulator [Streptomyces sp. NBC_00199]|uniref:helix-turn-helix domain-containing protein n=1 Tax=Streptomyces sp. NBC_00199 TaxID=2975678 RepID=UPI00225AD170|nr:helix-turn-helix transcriptional regulator [Streptomyces sp. NBC_00199]MCX5265710.1 helix-turn-helix domain-containing protein [Streptomyces sp. NBC_00199]
MDVYALPHPALRELIQGAYHAGMETLSPGEVIAVPASLSVSLNLNLGEPPAGLPVAYAAGPGHLYRYGGSETSSQLTWVGLRLTLPGAYRLLGAPPADLAGQVVDLAEVFGTPGRVLAERCRAARSHPELFALLDAFLLCRSIDGPRPSAEIVRSWQLLTRSAGRARIAALAADVGWSGDHLGRVFRRQVGLPPKTAARLMRLKNLLGCVDPERTRWPELAADHGYSDQSHFNRELREFTGMSPSQYISRLRTCGCLSAAPKPPGLSAKDTSDSFKTAVTPRS